VGDVTLNISRSECACNCGCGQDVIDYELALVIQCACDHFSLAMALNKVTAIFTSINRCKWHNEQVGGVKGSLHTTSCAADWYILEVSVEDLYKYLCEKYSDKYGLGYYNDDGGERIHLDIGEYRRWSKNTKNDTGTH